MKNYLAFLGNNATTGNPHPITGRLNAWGKLYSFDSKAERDQFCETYCNLFNRYPIATNAKEAKSKYFAGLTQAQFDQQLLALTSGAVEFI